MVCFCKSLQHTNLLVQAPEIPSSCSGVARHLGSGEGFLKLFNLLLLRLGGNICIQHPLIAALIRAVLVGLKGRMVPR